MKKNKIYLIHGYTASPDSNWFPHLKKQLDNENTEVFILNMPDSDHPKLKDWLNHMDNEITQYDKNTVFIGHSLGCVSILNFLEKKSSKKIKALFLVSGFIEKSPIPELVEFVVPQLNYGAIKEVTDRIVSISAIDDDIVPYDYSKVLAEKLNAKFVLLNEGKHFIGRDNFTEFPYLINEVKKCLTE